MLSILLVIDPPPARAFLHAHASLVWVLEGERTHEKWECDMIPSLHTARIHPTVFSYKSSMLVACGGISDCIKLNRVTDPQ